MNILSHIKESDATPYYGGLLFGIVVFIGFGLFHLALFETVDKHLSMRTRPKTLCAL